MTQTEKILLAAVGGYFLWKKLKKEEGDLGQGVGRMQGDKPGAGPGGRCICPSCGTTVAHGLGIPCYTKLCPFCGTRMTRE